jgi:hypothetical protein
MRTRPTAGLGFRRAAAYVWPMKGKRKSTPQRWQVTRIVGNAARQITELEADSAAEAIKRAIKEYEITDPQQQRRLAARPVS